MTYLSVNDRSVPVHLARVIDLDTGENLAKRFKITEADDEAGWIVRDFLAGEAAGLDSINVIEVGHSEARGCGFVKERRRIKIDFGEHDAEVRAHFLAAEAKQ